MLESSIIYILVRTFPECIILILSGLILLGIKIDIKNIIKNGIIYAILITFIRLLPINFGVHTILSMITLGFILYNLSGKNLIKSMVSTCTTWISLALSEAIYIVIATGILKIPFDKLTNNTSLYAALMTLPSLIVLLCLVFVFRIIINKVNEVLLRY